MASRIAADIEFYAGISTAVRMPTRSLLLRFAGQDKFAGTVHISSDALPVVAAGAHGRCELEFLRDPGDRAPAGTSFTIHYPPSTEIGRGTVVA